MKSVSRWSSGSRSQTFPCPFPRRAPFQYLRVDFSPHHSRELFVTCSAHLAVIDVNCNLSTLTTSCRLKHTFRNNENYRYRIASMKTFNSLGKDKSGSVSWSQRKWLERSRNWRQATEVKQKGRDENEQPATCQVRLTNFMSTFQRQLSAHLRSSANTQGSRTRTRLIAKKKRKDFIYFFFSGFWIYKFNRNQNIWNFPRKLLLSFLVVLVKKCFQHVNKITRCAVVFFSAARFVTL